MWVAKIDAKGFYTGDIEVDNIRDLPTDLVVDRPINTGLFKPKWDGKRWIEGATQEYIDSIVNAPTKLTEIEKLRIEQAQANAELVQLIMMMGGA